MNLLRWVKLVVLLGVPLLAALYAYQFTGQAREEIVPFKPFKMDSVELYSPAPLQAAEATRKPVQLPLRAPVTLVNIWATWCPPCVEEFPAMLELQRRLEDSGLEIVFVSIDENWADVDAFFKKHGLEVKAGRLFWDPERKLAAHWGTEKFPESYVIRPDGWVVERIVGLQQWTRPVVIEYFEKLSQKFKSLKDSGAT
jgi:thiol-disulfide isomerase/thioredoxin